MKARSSLGSFLGNDSLRSVESEATGKLCKNTPLKRQRTSQSAGHSTQPGSGLGKRVSTFRSRMEPSQYKPLLIQQESLGLKAGSLANTLSSLGPLEDSNIGELGWRKNGSGAANRRKRRHDGAIIYYTGAPFCADLTGDPGDVSHTTYTMSSRLTHREQQAVEFDRSIAFRSLSGSSLCYQPLRDEPQALVKANPVLAIDTGSETGELHIEISLTDERQYSEVCSLEPCGLGGVLPDDHFMVVVTMERPRGDISDAPDLKILCPKSTNVTDDIINRLVSISTSSPVPHSIRRSSLAELRPIEIIYVSGRMKRLSPNPLPPPATFFPPSSNNTTCSDDVISGSFHR